MSEGMWVIVDSAQVERLAGRWDDVAAELGDALAAVVAALMWVRSTAGPSPVTASRATGLLEDARAAVFRLRQDCLDRAAEVREAARAYDGAEQPRWFTMALDRIGTFPAMPLLGADHAIEVVLEVGVSSLRGQPPFPAERAQRLSEAFLLPLAMPAVQALGLSSRPRDPVDRAMAEVALSEVRPSASAPAASSVVDLAHRIEGAYEAARESGRGAVEVQQIAHADGEVTWVVSVPGTVGALELTLAPTQPMNPLTNYFSFTGVLSSAESMTLAAMAAAGIPAGDRVLLAGHSQGGMTASRLAADPGVRSRFAIAGVVTYGSPVAHMPSAGVPTLNLQHEEDGVPALAGGLGPPGGEARADELWVIRDLEGAYGLDGEPLVHDPHGVVTYADTAAGFESGGSLGLAEWRRDTDGLWAGPGDVVTATTYIGSQ